MKTNAILVDHLIDTNRVVTASIINAFRSIDRQQFCLEETKHKAYHDCPLSIGYNQTISQPTTVAMMLEMLSPQEGDYICDIGSGSGYTTALLSNCVGSIGRVVGLERINELVDYAIQNLKACGVQNATILNAGPQLGKPDQTFDKYLVSAAAKEVPRSLLEQLTEGARLVVPVNNSIVVIDKKNDKLTKKEYHGFTFVPLIYE